VKFSVRALIALCSLIAMLTFAAPASAYPTNTNTTNMAGRPFGGSAGDGAPFPDYRSCQGIAYGKVNGQKVLFIPNHCTPDAVTKCAGTSWSFCDKDNNLIGQYASASEISSNFDYAYILLTNGVWPSNPDQICCGDDNGTACWRSNTSAKPSSDTACANIDVKWGLGGFSDNVYASFQTNWTSQWDNRTGNVVDWFNNQNDTSYCQILTDLASHCDTCYIDSGTPFHLFGYGQAPAFFAHKKVQITCGEHQGLPPCTESYGTDLVIKPIYNPMTALDNYWESHGNNLGAHFCTDSSCSAI